MILFRILAVSVVIPLMTGCMIDRLTSDVAAVKTYLRGSLAPGQCKAPGDQEGAKSCYYRLEMTEPDPRDKAKGLFSAKISPEVYKQSFDRCPEVNKIVKEEFYSLVRDCPKKVGEYPDMDVVYTFTVDGDTSGLDVKGTKADMESVPGSKHLRKSEIKFIP